MPDHTTTPTAAAETEQLTPVPAQASTTPLDAARQALQDDVAYSVYVRARDLVLALSADAQSADPVLGQVVDLVQRRAMTEHLADELHLVVNLLRARLRRLTDADADDEAGTPAATANLGRARSGRAEVVCDAAGRVVGGPVEELVYVPRSQSGAARFDVDAHALAASAGVWPGPVRRPVEAFAGGLLGGVVR